MKKTIVIFIGGYLPGKKYGGPVTSLENFINQMCDQYNIRVICSDHDFKDEKRYENISNGWNQVGNAQVYYINEKEYSYKSFLEIVNPFYEEIEFFYLSGIYYIKMNYAAMKVAKKINKPVLLAPRGDLMKNTISMNSKVKMIKKLTFLKIAKIFNVFSNIYFQSTSNEETLGLKKYLGIPKDRIFEVVNMPMLKNSNNVHLKKKNELRIMFISRLMVKKNLYFAIDVVGKINKKYNVIFDIYGPKEDLEYWSKCEKKITQVNKLNSNCIISYKGSLNPNEAKNIYEKYDCFLFPTTSENYGHVIAESMLSDCPVILSKGTTPWDDYNENGGYVISLEEPNRFTECLEKIAEMDNQDYNELIQLNRKYIDNKFKIKALKKEYLKMINIICKR